MPDPVFDLPPPPPDAAQYPVASVSAIADALPLPVAYRFGFLGVGQAGARMAEVFWSLGYRRVAIFNTTQNDFSGISPEILRFVAEIKGSAKDPARSHKAAQDSQDAVRDMLRKAWGDDVEIGMVLCGLGGGTGSGAGPVLLDVARGYLDQHGAPSPRCGALVSIPDPGEGPQVARNALEAFEALHLLAPTPFLLVDNLRVHKLYDPKFTSLYGMANRLIASLLHAFNQFAAQKEGAHIAFDGSELGQIFDGGITVLGAIDLNGVTHVADVQQKVRDSVAANVLADVDPRTGDRAACLFVGSGSVLDQLAKDYFDAGFAEVDRLLDRTSGRTPVVHRGVYSLPGGCPARCYVAVGGAQPPALTGLRKTAKG